jgi:H+/Cl- antiporter ClcA
MNVAHRVPASAPPHALLLLLALAVLLIAGLLGMHTFTGDAMGHGTPATMSAAHTVVSDGSPDSRHAMTADATAASHDCDDSCATGHGGDHASMGAACVLALLAGLLLILPPLLLGRRGLHHLLRVPASDPPAGLRPPRPPSLLLLSISRT